MGLSYGESNPPLMVYEGFSHETVCQGREETQMGKKNGQSWEDRALKDARELGVPMWTTVEDPGPGQTSTRVTMGIVTPKGVRSNTAGSHAGEDVAAEKAAKKTVGLLFRWSVARRAQGMPHPRPFWDWKKHSGGGVALFRRGRAGRVSGAYWAGGRFHQGGGPREGSPILFA